jgi:hypothetical protein
VPDYSNQELINDVVNRIFIPIAQPTFTDATLMRTANSVLQDEIVPAIMSVRNDYFVKHEDYTPTDGLVNLPSKAVGGKLRAVHVVNSQQNGGEYNLPEITIDQLAAWDNGYGYNSSYGYGGGYNIQGMTLHLVPRNTILNGVLRLYYFNEPLVLTAPANYGKVTAVDTGTNTVTLDNVPDFFTTGLQVNAVKGQPNFDTSLELATIVSTSSPDVVLSDVTGISVGDYLSEYGYSAVAQIPTVWRGCLAQLTGAKCLEGLGDKDGAKVALEKAAVLKANALIPITPRIDGSPKKIMHLDGGLVGNIGFGGFGGWGGRGRSF